MLKKGATNARVANSKRLGRKSRDKSKHVKELSLSKLKHPSQTRYLLREDSCVENRDRRGLGAKQKKVVSQAN
jgi:hypothetical protein